jgi:membrane protein implicated in regulation of membrane protease activity
MKNYWKELRAVIIAEIGAFILAMILPPRVTITCRELFFYAGLSLFKSWIVTLTAVTISFLLVYLIRHFWKPRRKKTNAGIGENEGAESQATNSVKNK